MPVRMVSDEELPGPLKGYRLIERLGRGGFGEVWKVEAPGGLLKAMKFVYGDLEAADEDGRPAEQELKALHRVKSIRHPYVLSLERFDVLDGHLIIVMELADRNLWDRFRECRAQGLPGVPRDELLRYLEEAAEALDLMNDQYQIQHLDVKPQNLFLVHNHVKVADFGLAKLFEGDRGTVTGGVTPVYAAPETFEGWVSRFTDQYSLAIVFQELLTAVRPFTGANTKQLLLQHLNGVPDLNPLAAADQAVIARALNKKPDDRWPSCSDLIRALRSAGNAAGVTPVPFATPGPRVVADTPRPADRPATGPAHDRGRAAPSPATGSSGVILPPLVRPGGSGAMAHTQRPPQGTPRLITPRESNGSSGVPAPNQTIQRLPDFQTGRMSSLGIAPPEKTGDGVLFPAVVVGVGQTGLAVLRKLRELIRARFGSADAVPVVRFLYVDTDPETASAATQGPDALQAREVVLARLNRPAHYLQMSGGQSVDAWMPPGALYRLAKTPGPAAGVRAFGRLALCDHYRVIAQRVRQQIEPFLTDDPLEKAAAETGLGVRSNRCRAYIVAGTAGGTGSGMLVDLAYVIKHELRGVGYRKPEAVGVLLVPPADKAAPRSPLLANTFAALTEVFHFTAGSAKYSQKFEPNEPAVTDPDGPFVRCAVVQLPKVPKEPERGRAIGLAARGLYAELLTAAGRVTDAVRATVPLPGTAVAAVAHVSGLYRLSWPRAELLTAAVRVFTRRMLDRWAAKEAGHLRAPVHTWLADQWDRQQLDPQAVVDRFEAAVRTALKDDATAVFEAVVAPLRTRAARPGAADACDVFEQLLTHVGRPDGESETPGTLEAAVQAARKTFAAEVETKLATVAVSFIEQPQYRLAGAEEALNQITERVKQVVDGLDAQRNELVREVKEAYSRVLQLIAGLKTGHRRSGQSGELSDALRTYAARKLQSIELGAAVLLYHGLLGAMPDYIRDVNFCRTRLGELGNTAGGLPAVPPDPADEVQLLPPGCATLDDAAEKFVSGLGAEDLLEFDQALQRRITKKYRGVASVCLKPERSAGFLSLTASEVRSFLNPRLDRSDPAAALLRHFGEGDGTRKLLADAYAKAAPTLTPWSGPPEGAVLAVPPGEAGDQVRRLAAAACPTVEFVPAPVADDILILREYPRVELGALPQTASHAREAYENQLASDHTPHTRADIAWAAPGG